MKEWSVFSFQSSVFGSRRLAFSRLLASLSLVTLSAACLGRSAQQVQSNDLEGASEALQFNIAAIHRRDVNAYLAQYLNSPDFVVTSADSLRRGYLLFAEARRASEEWPDTLIAGEPELVWIAPGVVWGGFEYAAVMDSDTVRGWSQRVFVKTTDGWKIAVTGASQR